MFLGSPVPQVINLSELEYKLLHQKDPLQRLILLDKLAGHYTYTNVRRAQELLDELSHILGSYENPDYKLDYHWYSAIIDNQLYNFTAAEEHFLKTIEILEERGTIKQQAEAYIDYAGVCMNQEKMDKATRYLDKAGKLLKSFPDDRLLARITCREGFMNLHYGNYSRAIELLLAADKSITMQGQPLELKDY